MIHYGFYMFRRIPYETFKLRYNDISFCIRNVINYQKQGTESFNPSPPHGSNLRRAGPKWRLGAASTCWHLLALTVLLRLDWEGSTAEGISPGRHLVMVIIILIILTAMIIITNRPGPLQGGLLAQAPLFASGQTQHLHTSVICSACNVMNFMCYVLIQMEIKVPLYARVSCPKFKC